MTGGNLQTDVVVVGAGLVGLSATLALHRIGYEVTIVDANLQHETVCAQPEWDQRIYAISPQNVDWLKTLGVWQHLDTSRLTVVETMQIWADPASPPLEMGAEEINADAMAYIVEERALKEAFMHQLAQQSICTLFGVQCSRLESASGKNLLHIAGHAALESPLVLAADGVNSWVRQQLNIAIDEKEYHQIAIVANFNCEQTHGNIARQWFMQASETSAYQGILAWLPLPGNRISIVWSAPASEATALMQLDNAAFTDKVMQAGRACLGQLTLMDARATFPLMLKRADTLVKNGVVLIGDAAHRIHPMAGQGVNLGFRDVIDLARVLAEKHVYQPSYDPALLKKFERSRKADLSDMVLLTNGLYYLFSHSSPWLARLTDWGFAAVRRPILRKGLAKHAILR